MQHSGAKPSWTLLVTSPAWAHGALRIRAWRALKGMGCAVLPDGVSRAPSEDGIRGHLQALAGEISASGGSASVVPSEVADRDFQSVVALFDPSDQYGDLITSAEELPRSLAARTEVQARRAFRQLSRDLSNVESIDFFGSELRKSARAAFAAAEEAIKSAFSPDEPTSVSAVVPQLDLGLYQRHTWATRANLWVGRVASCWLIKRVIEPQARFVWLQNASECPASALGFDFDGASFSHVND